MDHQDFEEKTLTREVVYQGKIIEVVVDEVALPNGGTAKRELVFHNGAVAIMPLTATEKMVFVKQFRKPIEKVILEIPAGKIELGETEVLAVAKRELEEETGFQAKEWQEIAHFVLSPGFANEVITIFEARDLIKIEVPLKQDDDEFIELVELTLTEAKQAVKAGLICDAKTIYAVQYWELMLLKKKLKA